MPLIAAKLYLHRERESPAVWGQRAHHYNGTQPDYTRKLFNCFTTSYVLSFCRSRVNPISYTLERRSPLACFFLESAFVHSFVSYRRTSSIVAYLSCSNVRSFINPRFAADYRSRFSKTTALCHTSVSFIGMPHCQVCLLNSARRASAYDNKKSNSILVR